MNARASISGVFHVDRRHPANVFRDHTWTFGCSPESISLSYGQQADVVWELLTRTGDTSLYIVDPSLEPGHDVTVDGIHGAVDLREISSTLWQRDRERTSSVLFAEFALFASPSMRWGLVYDRGFEMSILGFSSVLAPMLAPLVRTEFISVDDFVDTRFPRDETWAPGWLDQCEVLKSNYGESRLL